MVLNPQFLTEKQHLNGISADFCGSKGVSQVVLVVKNLPANAGDERDVGSILGSGRSPGGENGNPLQYSCLENPWTEEPGGLQSMESQRVGYD